MPPIRVLTVDDAVVVRRLLGDALSAEPDMEIVGTAATGRIALQKIPQCVPDVVTLDIEMPDMNGIETVREIRRTWPDLPVIMFSTLTERGATATFDALAAGATDYVTKPSNVGSITAGLAKIRLELAPKIRELAASRRRPQPSSASPKPAPARSTLVAPAATTIATTTRRLARVDAVVIGTSTGGPNALASLLPALEADLNVPVLIVQHMPKLFTRLLAERLNQQCRYRVVEAAAGDIVKPQHIYIAPGDFHMTVRRRGVDVVVELNQEPPENSCRPAVDVLFRSAAALYGAHTLAVVMTGMGQDGLAGARHIKEAGGDVITQDEATSVVWGMPGYVTRAGLSSAVLPLDHLPIEISRAVRGSHLAPPKTPLTGSMVR